MQRKHLQIRFFIPAVCVLVLLAGCGYRPVALRGPLAEANGVNVVLFGNKSYRPGIPGTLARDLVDELALRSGGKVLPGDQAQLELNGTVLSYSTIAVSYTAQDAIKEYRSVLTVQAVLVDHLTGKVLWKKDLTEEQVFPVNPNIGLQQNAEETAIDGLCRKLARDVWQKIGERF